MVELHPKRATLARGNREVQSLVLGSKLVKIPQGLAGEITNLGIVALLLKLRDDHHRKDNLVFRKAEYGPRI